MVQKYQVMPSNFQRLMPRVLVPILRKPALIVNGPLVSLKRPILLKCVQDTALMLDKRILNLIKKYHNLENYRQKNGNNYLKYMNRASTLISPSLYQRLKIWPNNLRNIKTILTLMLIQLERFISFFISEVIVKVGSIQG